MEAKRYHIIADIEKVSSQVITDKDGLGRFIRGLVEAIGMKILHGPTVIEGVPENPGLTGFVIIDYSHVSVHTFSNSNEALVDVFSCKSFDKNKAIEVVANYFQIPSSAIRLKEVFWG